MGYPKGKVFNRPVAANYFSSGGEELNDVAVDMMDSDGNIMLCDGDSVPSGDAGFAKGCLFRKFDASGDGLYRNTGTTSSCTFEALDTIVASEIVLADGDSFDDSGGLEVIKFGVTASAVNEVSITNAATGSGPIVSATGDDANISLNLTPKGSAGVVVNAAPQSGLMVSVVDDGATGGGLNLYQNSASPAADDVVGSVIGTGKSDAAADVVYGQISLGIDDPSSGAEYGLVYVEVMENGSAVEYLAMGSGLISVQKPVLMEQTEQALSGAGAVDVVSQTTNWNCSGAVAGTLADGEEGQRKVIYCGTYVGNGTLTPSNLLGLSTITFTAAGQGVELEFRGTSWVVIGNAGATLA